MKEIYFWKTQGENSIYSQWYPAGFSDEKQFYENAEQYMMYQKALLFNDKEIAEKILQNIDPARIKTLGRQIKGFKENVWNAHKEEIVFQGNLLKFTQNIDLKKRLISEPVDTLFVEASPMDRIWGIGFDAKNAVKNRKKWGENLLGKCIGRVRVYLD
jgi:ribA/ribD-fused uncharacterized protein